MIFRLGHCLHDSYPSTDCNMVSEFFECRALLCFSEFLFSSWCSCYCFLFSCTNLDYFFFQTMPDENPTLTSPSEQPMCSYLYLHPSENPAASLVSPVLDSIKYNSWSQSFITTLSTKNKLEFILGSHPCPQKDVPTFSVWSHCNNIL